LLIYHFVFSAGHEHSPHEKPLPLANKFENLYLYLTMKHFLSCILILALTNIALSQSAVKLDALNAPENAGNIHVEKISEDSLSSAFVIWIKNEVAEHKHLRHTENIYVLEGSGIMTLDNDTFSITPGQHVFIPCNTFHSVKVNSSVPLKVISIQSPRFDPTDRILRE
jgi:mannose-6-phosphate isomerase-like protein (cupin superfamily)